VCLTEDLVIHVIEIPKFHRTLEGLRTPLDFWLYFFKNGIGLDADALPESLDRPELRKAMGVLKMLAQNDMERELYEGRLKARRDLQTLETQRRTLEAQTQTLEAQTRTLQTQRDHWQERYESANREREQARREVHRELAERVRLCQRLLQCPVSPAEELQGQSVEALRELAETLERDLTK
jgi:chromosome segregation ATPase